MKPADCGTVDETRRDTLDIETPAFHADAVGNISCVYVYVGGGVDLTELAEDIRNQGPTVLTIVCEEEGDASTIEKDLHSGSGSQASFADVGQPAVAGMKRYMCIRSGRLIVAARAGIAERVRPHYEKTLDVGGALFTAEVALNASFCDMESFQVAVVATPPDSSVVTEIPWECVLGRPTLLLAGEVNCSVQDFLRRNRSKTAMDIAAWLPFRDICESNAVSVTNSFMFLLVPAQQLQVARCDFHELPVVSGSSDGQQIFTGDEDEWNRFCEKVVPKKPTHPRIVQYAVRSAKQKIANRTFNGVRKLCAFFSGKESNRTRKAQRGHRMLLLISVQFCKLISYGCRCG